MAYSVINDLLVLGSVPYKSTKVYVPPRKMNMFPPFLKGSESFAPNFTNFQNGGSPPPVAPPGGRSGARCQSQCSLGGRRKVKLAGFAPENRSKRPKKKKNIFSNAWIFRGRLLLVSGWRYPSFWKYAVFFRWNWRKNHLFGKSHRFPRMEMSWGILWPTLV